MNCTVVITKEYKGALVLETLITADLPLFSMNDRFNRVNRPFINNWCQKWDTSKLKFTKI